MTLTVELLFQSVFFFSQQKFYFFSWFQSREINKDVPLGGDVRFGRSLMSWPSCRESSRSVHPAGLHICSQGVDEQKKVMTSY